MARKNITICDRCGRECKDRYDRTVITTIKVDKDYDLCPACAGQLESWLEKDHTTSPGDSVEWEEYCACRIPCAGPCGSGGFRRR